MKKLLSLQLLVSIALFSCKEKSQVSTCNSVPSEVKVPEGFSIHEVLSTDTILSVQKFHMIDESTGFLYAQNSTAPGIYRTIDGGDNWEGNLLSFDHEISSAMRDIFFINSTTGILSYYKSPKLLRTMDGGKTWDSIKTPQNAGPIYDVQKDHSDNLYAIISNQLFTEWHLIKSSDLGLSWDTITENCGWELRMTENFIYTCSKSQILSKYDLQGNLLEEIAINLPPKSHIRSWVVLNDQHFVFSSLDEIISTQDGGKTWDNAFDTGGDIVDYSDDHSSFVLLHRGYCDDSHVGFSYSSLALSEDYGVSWTEGEKIRALKLSSGQKIGKSQYLVILNQKLYQVDK